MNNSFKQLERLMVGMTSEEHANAIENRFPYIFSKAHMFLKMGHENYRENDAFHQPDVNFTADDIEILKSGCRQLLEGCGLTKERALTGLDVAGFYALMHMFHFEPISKNTIHGFKKDNIRGAMDKITFRHLMDGEKAILYNFCEYPRL